jgi:hypothetical protein
LREQDRFVPESHSPLDVAMDLLVYVPVGLALSAVAEVPKLAAKGRAQLGGQIAMARVVGQFALAQGRKELARRFSPAHSSGAGRPVSPGSATGAEVDGAAGDGAAVDGVGPDPTFEDLLARSEPALIADAAAGSGGGPAGPSSPASEPRPDPSGLAIPGYDSLAASQVVQRLAGLADEELAAVGAYESAHRARRTILTRVRQLQDR